MKKTIIASLALIIVTVMVISVASAKNENDKGNNSASSKSKIEKTKILKDFEKPTREKTNASIHKQKTDEVSVGLLEIAESEKNKDQQNREEKTKENKIGNPNMGEQEQVKTKTREEIASELEEVSEQTEAKQDETVEAINEIEQRGGFKKFLIGTDYENLGQLRSSLAHNENQTRKLTSLLESTVEEETKTAIQDQLIVLMQERERIKTVISENEQGFSLLGWVFRLMNGYQDDAIDEEEELMLEEDVLDVLEDEEEDGTETT